MSSEDGGDGVRLWDRLTRPGGSSQACSLHYWTGDGYRAASWAEVARDAEAMTAGLRRIGVRPGSRVVTVMSNTLDAVRGLLAVWLAGGAMASMPAPARGMSAADYARQLAAIAGQIEPVAFLVDAALLDVLPGELGRQYAVHAWQSFAGSGRAGAAPPAADEPAFVQYSSGSTNAPKGCVLTARAIAAQLDIVASLIEVRPGRDITVSWLPLSHDMGMFGVLLTSWWNNLECYLSTPERFMVAPGTWFSDLARAGGTLTVGSNTGLYLAARSFSRRSAGQGRGLDQTRVCIVGAERVDRGTLDYAVQCLGPYGFREGALMPAYGLAEATLAVTGTPIAEPPRSLRVDAAALADGELREASPDDPAGTTVVSSGPPCPGVALPGTEHGQLTEIAVRSPSLALGYWKNEALTRERFGGGRLRTGDLGFVRDGYLYPVGRTDDVISVAGRKVYAREVELAVDDLAGVRRGCSTLVGHHEGSALRLTLFIEIQSHQPEYRALAERAASLAMSKAAVAIDECVFLRRNGLPKTASGKIQRHRCRPMFEAGQLGLLSTVRLAPA